MFCTSCGRGIDGNARFCSNCGAAVAEAPEGAPFAAGYGSASAAPPPSYGGYPRGMLVRPRDPRMIAGVCSGIAEHYGWDVTIVRLVLVLSVLTAGFGIGLYLILWIVIPDGPYALPGPAGTNPGSPPL